MFIYSLYNRKRDKEYIGFTMQGTHGSEEYQMKIIHKDIEEIIQYNENLDLIADIRNDGIDEFDISIIAVVSTLTKARTEEQLAVSLRNTMAPNGYNEKIKTKEILDSLS